MKVSVAASSVTVIMILTSSKRCSDNTLGGATWAVAAAADGTIEPVEIGEDTN